MTVTLQPEIPVIRDPAAPDSWHKAADDAAAPPQPAEHELYWRRTCGNALAVLAHGAGYTPAAQSEILRFFAGAVAPYLGPPPPSVSQSDENSMPGRTTTTPRWESFMTDDHSPVELSWDWHTGNQRPTIRFSVEPVGVDAGGPRDPDNEVAPAELKRAVLSALPKTDTLWFDHFSHFFGAGQQTGSEKIVEGHRTTVFWAFDLDPERKGIESKGYFFPGPRAAASGLTNLELISQAVLAAPGAGASALDSLAPFASYAREVESRGHPPLEMDMLAIDMTRPTPRSRLKVYARSRRTSFASVRETMTLGGRVAGPDIDKGLARLRGLWDELFGKRDEDESLPEVHHRTSGILYNVEFRVGGGGDPVVKIYIPVRHYAASDWAVLTAVSRLVDGQREAGYGLGGPDPFAYTKAMYAMFNPEALLTSKGIHTYIACSIQPGGLLRVVSYLNLQEGKFRQHQ